MSNNKPASASFSEIKALRAYNFSALIMAIMIVASGAIHYTIMDKQKALLQAYAMQQEQFSLTQRIAMLLAQYQQEHDPGTLAGLKEATASALVNHDTLSPVMLATLPQEYLSDGSSVHQNEM